MNLVLTLVALVSVALVHAQQGDKGNSIIPFPRVGRGGGNSPGLIPFPRIGKRQMIPFPRVGKRAFWHLPMPMESAYFTEYEDFNPMMEQSSTFPFAVESNNQEDNDMDKRNGPNSNSNAGGGMWFGPRLGRKKRSTDAVTESSKESLDIKPLLKMLHNSNWAIIVPVKERRNFTPRLGRRSSNADVNVQQRAAQPFSPRLGRSGEQSFDDDEESVETNTHFQRRSESLGTAEPPTELAGPPFSPRLGRADPFSPRLGRSDPFSPRLGRADPFSPRLGRADPFSPRLGRSGQNADDRERD